GSEQGDNGQPAALVQERIELIAKTFESFHGSTRLPMDRFKPRARETRFLEETCFLTRPGSGSHATSRCSRMVPCCRSISSRIPPSTRCPIPNTKPIISTAQIGPRQSVRAPRNNRKPPRERIGGGA